MLWVMNGMRRLVKEVGLKAVRKAGPVGRMRVYDKLFCKDRVMMTKKFPGPCKAVTPVEDIFSGKSDTHLKWQLYHGTTFGWICEDGFTLRIDSKEDFRDKCYDNWRSYPRRPEIDNLNVGRLQDIPVRNMGVYDKGLSQLVVTEPYDSNIYTVIDLDSNSKSNTEMDDDETESDEETSSDEASSEDEDSTGGDTEMGDNETDSDEETPSSVGCDPAGGDTNG
jgi:hypothetical protein